MTPRNTTILLQLTAVLLALAAAPGLCTEADWWDEADAEDPGYRVANYEEKFENEGVEEGEYPECSWECYDSRSTDWYITETTADVKYKPEGGEYAHVANEGGAGTVEVSSTTRVYVHYWPGVVPSRWDRTDTGTASGADSLTLADASKSWDPTQWAGGTIEITGGTGAGQTRTIGDNTRSELTVTQAWATVPDATSSYSLEGQQSGRYSDYGYIWVYCKRPYEQCEPPARSRQLWVLDCNLETARGGTPGNNNQTASPNDGDGSAQDRQGFDQSDSAHVLPVMLNDDDDDQDESHTPDREQAGPVSGEDDLVPLRFQFTQGIEALQNDAKQSDKGKVTVRVAGDAPDQYGDHPRLKLWKSAAKGTSEEIVLAWDGTWYKKEYDLNSQWSEFTADLWNSLRDRTLYVEGYERSAAYHDAVVELEYELDYKYAIDTALYTVLGVDLDIDSDSDNEYGAPERNAEEDGIEDVADDPAISGKIIATNDDDSDEDGIPDFADGFDLDGVAGSDDDAAAGEQFVQVVLELPVPMDPTQAHLTFTYDASDPAEATYDENASPAYAAAGGRLRLWREPGECERDPASVQDDGDYIPSGARVAASKVGFASDTREVTLYLEGIGITSSAEHQRIAVRVDPDGSGPQAAHAFDAVRTTSVRIEFVRADTMEVTEYLSTSGSGPKVHLDPISLDDVTVTEDQEVRVHLSGTVWDKVADLVPDNAADITAVYVGDQAVSVERDATEEPTKARPYAFKGLFEGDVTVAIGDGATTLLVRSMENALGQWGNGNFTVNSHTEERYTPAYYFGLAPFRFEIASLLDPEERDTVLLLLDTEVDVDLGAAPDPDQVDQITLLVGTDEVTLTETGNNTLVFAGTDADHGDCEVDLSAMGALDPNSPDVVTGPVSVGDIHDGEALPYRLEESGDDSKFLRGERAVEVTEAEGQENSQVFHATTTDYGQIELTIQALSGLSPAEMDTCGALLSLPTQWTGSQQFDMVESDVDTRMFVPDLEGSLGQEKVMVRVIDSVAKEDDADEVGGFESYFVRVWHAPGQAKDRVTLGGIEMPLEEEEGNPGAYITAEPFILVAEPPTTDDDHIIERDDDLECSYNPTKKVKDRGMYVISAQAKDEEKYRDRVLPGPFWLWGDNLAYDNEGEGKADGEGIVRVRLEHDVKSVKIKVCAAKQASNVVYEAEFQDAHHVGKGLHTFWDGRCTHEGGKDGDGDPNVVGGDPKLLDPKIGRYTVAVTTKDRNNVEATTEWQLDVRRTRLYVFDDSDCKDNSPMSPFIIFPGAMIYGEEGLVRRSTIKAGKEIVDPRGGWLYAGKSRFPAHDAPRDQLAKNDALLLICAYQDTIKDRVDGPGRAVTFREAYRRLTARGELVSVGHGSQGSIVLDTGKPFLGFKAGAPNDPIVPEQKYPLPYLGVHGVDVTLVHCESGAGSHLEELMAIIGNDAQNAGWGHGHGFGGEWTSAETTEVRPKTFGISALKKLQRYQALFTGVNDKADDPDNLGRGPQRARSEFRSLTGYRKGKIDKDAKRVALEDPRGAILQPPNPLPAQLLKGTLSEEEFTYASIELRADLGFVSDMVQCVGLEKSRASGAYNVLLLNRGGFHYHGHFMCHRFSVETRGSGGRLERFTSDILSTIQIEAGKTADTLYWYRNEHSWPTPDVHVSQP